MRPKSENQYRGIPDWNTADIDLSHDFANMSALPTGVEFYSLVTGGSAGTVAFEGLNGGRINMTVPSATRWLRFVGWDLATATIYKRALFECEGLYFDDPSTNNRTYYLNLRDTTNVAHGVFVVFRPTADAEICYNNGTTTVTDTVTWNPARFNRGQKLTLGIGYEYDSIYGTKELLLTVNGKVAWRQTYPNMSLAGTLRPSFAITATSHTAQIYMHGARLRLWRLRGA